MGVALIGEVLERAPVSLLPYDRLVLLALAEKANDRTSNVLPSRHDYGECTSCHAQPALCAGHRADEAHRGRRVALGGDCCPDCRHVSEQPRDTLRRRTGMTDAALTKVFQRLARAGLEVRVPFGSDSRGRPVYSYPGRGTNFRLPETPGPLSSHKAGPESAQAGMAGRGSIDAWTVVQASQPEWVDQDPTPVRHSVNGSVIDARELGEVPAEHRAAVLDLLTRLGDQVSEADAAACVAWAASKAKTNLAGYVSRFTAEEVRAKAGGRAGVATPPAAARAGRCSLPGHRGPSGVDADGDPFCGECADARTVAAS